METYAESATIGFVRRSAQTHKYLLLRDLPQVLFIVLCAITEKVHVICNIPQSEWNPLYILVKSVAQNYPSFK